MFRRTSISGKRAAPTGRFSPVSHPDSRRATDGGGEAVDAGG